MDMQITPLDPWISRKIGQSGLLDRNALEEYQLAKLQETLAFARSKSPFYQKLLTNSPKEVKKLSDLTKFPFTTAQDVRDHGLQLLCVSQDEIERVVTLDTTGTTGVPKRLYFTREDQELTIDFFHIGMSTFTRPGDNVLILLPGERPGSVGDLLAIGLKRLGANPIKHGIVRDFDEVLELINAEKVDVLVGIPTQVFGLARYGREIHLKSVLLSTDYAAPALRAAIESAWDCKVYDHYGMTEMGLGGGVECQVQHGMHLREADLYFEIINPDTGEPAADGETGEVVFTTMTRKGMPLIRYRTGDLSRFIQGMCTCGTKLKRLDRIECRLENTLRINDHITLTIAELDNLIFSVDGAINYDAEVTRENHLLFLNIGINAVGNNDQLGVIIEKKIRTAPSIKEALEQERLILQVRIIREQALPSAPFKRCFVWK
jgi:phenylacetate-coenzyme A ligase PaaK-like adenylate-forming protein